MRIGLMLQPFWKNKKYALVHLQLLDKSNYQPTLKQKNLCKKQRF
jgi:hypothetical protein